MHLEVLQLIVVVTTIALTDIMNGPGQVREGEGEGMEVVGLGDEHGLDLSPFLLRCVIIIASTSLQVCLADCCSVCSTGYSA